VVNEGALFPPLQGAGRGGAHVNVLSVTHDRKLHFAANQCKERVVFAHANAIAGVKLCSALTHEDVARDDLLAAEALYAQTLSVGVPAITGGAAALFGGEKLKVESKHGEAQYIMLFTPRASATMAAGALSTPP